MSTPDTMVFCPTYQVNGIDQVHELTLESIYNMRGEFDFVLGRFNPYSVAHLNILNQYRKGREIFLRGRYKYFMTIEHDMIVPPDALEMLMLLDVPVAYGVYMFRHGAKVINAYRYTISKTPDMSLSLLPEEFEKAKKQITPKVSGAGFGCMLVKREVLEQLDFHGKAGAASSIPDVEFAADCLKHGFEQRAHFLVECGHIEPGGNILYPFKGDDYMANVKLLQTLIVDVNGASTPLQAGKTYDLPAGVVDELVRAGYASKLEDEKPAVVSKRKSSTKSVAPVKPRGK